MEPTQERPRRRDLSKTRAPTSIPQQADAVRALPNASRSSTPSISRQTAQTQLTQKTWALACAQCSLPNHVRWHALPSPRAPSTKLFPKDTTRFCSCSVRDADGLGLVLKGPMPSPTRAHAAMPLMGTVESGCTADCWYNCRGTFWKRIASGLNSGVSMNCRNKFANR